MKSAAYTLASAILAGCVAASSCDADNCLRVFRATNITGRLQSAQEFCSMYTATGTAAATAVIPDYAATACASNQVGPESFRISSACSCIATSTATPTATASPTTANPCATVSSLWSAVAAVSPTPTIPAALAYECLRSVPLHKDDAIELVESIEPYLEWQTDAAYKADPPATYFYPAYDMFATLAEIKTMLENDMYTSEYDFQADLYAKVFGQGHDGHFVFYPDLLTRIFQFGRPYSLVSISEDGTSLPVIKVYEDVLSSPSTASTVTHINGIDAAKYVEDTIFTASFNQDPDAAYNSMFFSKASSGASDGSGFFSGSGRIRYIYQGANTTITFANGTELAFENFAQVKTPLNGITDGESLYTKFCGAVDSGDQATSASTSSGIVVPGYPNPIAITNDSIVSCYFLDGEGYEDVAVLSLLAFESESPSEFQAVQHECIVKAVAAGKTKLVVDLSANGGGYILQGYDFFRQLFPHIVQDGFSRWKENDGFMAVSKIYSDLVAKIDPSTSSDSDLIEDYESWFNYKYDLNVTDQPFLTFEDKFAPRVYKNTNYTAVMRWNLTDPLTTSNWTYGLGMEISGYGSLANLTQPFEAENIILVYDGYCASTCTIASEMLRIQAGVRSVAFGGRPIEGPIQGVGGIKGSQTLSYSDIHSEVQSAISNTEDAEQLAALQRYTETPIKRSSAAALNTRDQILRDNLEDGLPAQYVVEEADCRLYWTEEMITDVTAVWKGAANAAFNGGKCAAGSIPQSKKKRTSRIEGKRHVNLGKGFVDFNRIERRTEQSRVKFDARYNQKVIV
ncbi:peptidase s41 family protein [Grosmannia clavigera kw1407]|uniref:Peptidase s41 family protein n=1 Tax=Grosmannia clavigera (strain kw1407 / UAMH 11150) TaxID=655863 RepID=F0XCF5_GROCL|nr:peptidase s41 family protein [Grosmannia clavigera kw1407]EFX03689.1 peptidase s41 family protein [Grosmannia clavigera kw1407]